MSVAIPVPLVYTFVFRLTGSKEVRGKAGDGDLEFLSVPSHSPEGIKWENNNKRKSKDQLK